MSAVIHWFRQDLRLGDNPALHAAAAAGPVVPVYVLDEEAAGRWGMGGASRWWLERSLAELDRSLRGAGSQLIVRQGPAGDALAALAADCGASAVHFTRRIEPWAGAQEREVAARLRARGGVEARRFPGGLLFEPEAIRTGSGGPFRVFSPFSRAVLAAPAPREPLPRPGLAAPARWPASETIASLGLYPGRPDWAREFGTLWTPGEEGAGERLDSFLDRSLSRYGAERDRPDLASTSRLSPHLHFGELSPNRVWHAVQSEIAHAPDARAASEKLLSELLWREFSHHLLAAFPELPEKPMRPEFARFPYRRDAAGLRAWQRGLTGYPIVDAGLRQLWRTGVMHNRVRMIAASFLVKDLLLPWQEGAAWFWDALVDADLANNSAGWQWVAGSGTDAAPYFRIFNPVTQARKVDPEGAYVRRFVPELAGLPGPSIHAPWEATEEMLAAAGVRLGETYPRPIVDHAQTRRRALEAFEGMRAGGRDRS